MPMNPFPNLTERVLRYDLSSALVAELTTENPISKAELPEGAVVSLPKLIKVELIPWGPLSPEEAKALHEVLEDWV